MTKIAIVGTGYVGLVSGTCLAEVGHEVICCDISEEKIGILKNGEVPIYEIGLKELIDKNVKEQRLTFTINIDSAIKESEVIFSAVGTPMGESYEADLQYVKQVAKSFARNLNSYKIFVNKSTVPVGTGDVVKEIVKSITDKEFDIVSNPEFLREGAAVKDFLNPDRIIIGVESEKAKDIMMKVYKPFERAQSPIIVTDINSSELIKYASNAFLATKISFINEIARFCDKVGADVKAVAKGMGADNRIGPRFLQSGIGYGGSCFPKDVNALIQSGKKVGIDFSIINAVNTVNDSQKKYIVKKLKDKFGDNLNGKIIALWGLAFKPRTDDVREAPATVLINELSSLGAKIKVYDPIAMENMQKFYPELKVEYCSNNYNATENADILILVTEWDAFRSIDYEKLRNNMSGKLIVDGRNIYNPKEVKEEKFEYIGIGRENV